MPLAPQAASSVSRFLHKSYSKRLQQPLFFSSAILFCFALVVDALPLANGQQQTVEEVDKIELPESLSSKRFWMSYYSVPLLIREPIVVDAAVEPDDESSKMQNFVSTSSTRPAAVWAMATYARLPDLFTLRRLHMLKMFGGQMVLKRGATGGQSAAARLAKLRLQAARGFGRRRR